MTPETAVPVEGFEGLHFGTNGPYTNRLTPPDVQLAVGPNHVVEMVNVLGRISTKQGVAVTVEIDQRLDKLQRIG